MIKRLLLVLVAITLGILCETAIWGEAPTQVFPILVATCQLSVFLVLAIYNIEWFPARGSVWLFFPAIYFSITASLTAQSPESLKYILSVGFTGLYLALLSMTYRGGYLKRYVLSDYLQNFKRLIFFILRGPAQFIWQLVRDIFRARGNAETDADLSVPLSRGVGTLVFASLFALFWGIDSTFGEFFRSLSREILKVFELNGPNPLGVILWSYLILGATLYAGTESRDEYLQVNYPRVIARWFNFKSSALIFVAGLIPLTIFSSIRFYCLLDRGNCLTAEGFPTMMEAHFGFWALVIASAVVFAITYWLNHIIVFEAKWDRLVQTILNFCLFINVMVLLWAAGQNVSIQTLGIHTITRVWYARGGLFWLGLMFFMFIGYTHFEREQDFPYAALRVTTLLVGAFTFVSIITNIL